MIVKFAARSWVPLLIGGLLSLAACQSLGNWARANVAPIDWGDTRQMAFRLTPDRGGRPTIPVSIEGRELALTVDTGSSGGMMSPQLVSDLGRTPRDRPGKVNGQSAKMVRDVPLQLGDRSMEVSLVVHDGTMPAPVVLGAYLFLQAVVDMDFDTRRLTIIHPDDFDPPAAEPIKVKLWSSVPTVELSIPGREASVCAIVDTGFNGGLILSDQGVETLALSRDPARGTDMSVGPLGERSQRAGLPPLEELHLGNHVFRNVRLTSFGGMKHRCSNLLGMEVISRYRAIFDLGKRRMWLLPRVRPS